MEKKTKIITACVLAGVLTVAPLSAQLPFLGGGIPVFDAGNLAENVKQVFHQVQELKQLADTYDKVADHYKEAIRQGIYFKGIAGKYAHSAQVWQGLNASDTYQRAGRWIQAVNGDSKGAAIAWSIATLNQNPLPGEAFGRLSLLARDHLSADATGIDLIDGSAASALESVGKARLSGSDAEKALKRIEQDMLSDAPENQVLAVQMQHANALALESLKARGDANRLAVSQAELLAVNLKSQRDAAVRAWNREVALRTAPPLVTSLSAQAYNTP